MSNCLIALSLVAVLVSSVWVFKAEVQAEKPVTYSVSIADVLSNH